MRKKGMQEYERINNNELLEDALSWKGSKILITGVGISGKSTFRRALFQYLTNHNKNAIHYDADNFKKRRHYLDRHCLKKLPDKFSKNAIYLIEDVHGPIKNKAVLPINDYDKVLYLNHDLISHQKFWFQRMFNWYENGNFSWESKDGWNGTGKKRDVRNIPGIVNAYLNDMENREKWIKQDLIEIEKCPHQIIQSQWTENGPVFY